MQSLNLENVKSLDMKDNKTLTIIIIFILVCFACIYVCQTKKNVEEGFEQYNINEDDTVTLYKLNNVLVGYGNSLSLTDAINNIVDARLSTKQQSAVQFVGSLAYKRKSLLYPINNIYNLNKPFLEVFNWNKPENIKNVSPIQSLPPLQANTTYIFHLHTTAYTSISLIFLLCLDDNNNNTLDISTINNNNAFVGNANLAYYHGSIGGHFKVKTSAQNPNVVIGYIAEAANIVQDSGDSISLVIYKVINPTS